MRQYTLPKSLDEWEFVSVTWEDAFITRGGLKAADFLSAYKPCIRHTSGYLLTYDNDKIIIAATDDRESNTDQDCEDVNVIPMGMVRRITKKK